MVAQEFTVDLNAPLAFQVGHLGEAYDQWVHQPIVSKESPRFFKSDFCEFLTKTVWWAIPAIWLPVVCWSISRSVQMGCTFPQLAVTTASGTLIWTLLEYIIHRFLFHVKTKSYWGNTTHYLIHGYHHKHPMDRLRLVFPPAMTAAGCIPLYCTRFHRPPLLSFRPSRVRILFPIRPKEFTQSFTGQSIKNSFWHLSKLVAAPSMAPALFGGGLLGYIIYDCTHYYLHHGHPSVDSARNLKRYHMNHHFRTQSLRFGVTSSFWDWVLETLPPKF